MGATGPGKGGSKTKGGVGGTFPDPVQITLSARAARALLSALTLHHAVAPPIGDEILRVLMREIVVSTNPKTGPK